MPEPEDPPDAALDQALPDVYAELRRLAGHYLQRLSPGASLQPTAIVHEAYVRLSEGEGARWNSRSHFFALSARAMRCVLTDHVRSRRAAGRPSDDARVTLSVVPSGEVVTEVDVLDLDAALERLERVDARQARVVEYRFFAGLQVDEIAALLGVSDRTIKSDWRMAKAWLRAELERKA